MDIPGITVRPAVGKEKEKLTLDMEKEKVTLDLDISGITAVGKEKEKLEEDVKAAAGVMKREGCQICGDDHQHIIRCPYLEFVPPGGTVGPDYLVVCGECGYELKQPIPASCWSCGYWEGRVVGASTFDYSFRYHLDEFYIEEPVTAEYMDPDKYTEQKPEEPVTAENMDPDKYTAQRNQQYEKPAVQKVGHQDPIKKYHIKTKKPTQKKKKTKSWTLKKRI